MPRPIAAGVFGIARTNAQGASSASERNCSVRPAMIDTTTVDAATIGARLGITSRGDLRLYRDDDGGGVGECSARPD